MQVLYILMMKVKKHNFFLITFFVFPVGGSICKAFTESTFEQGTWA
jgi:hypothetical protein